MSDQPSSPDTGAGEKVAGKDAAPAEPPAPFFSRRPVRILTGLLVLAALAGTGYWFHVRNLEETDDAFVEADAGDVGTKVSGTVLSVKVADNQVVKAGDILAEIDPRDLKAAYERAVANHTAALADEELTRASTAATLLQAKAGLESAKAASVTAEAMLASSRADAAAAEANATQKDADEGRYLAAEPRSISKTQLDAARAGAAEGKAILESFRRRVGASESGIAEARAKIAAAEGVLAEAETASRRIAVAEARTAQSKAELDAARLSLSYATIRAPFDGRVTNRAVRPGQYLQVGQTLLAVVPRDYWVIANFKETQLSRMRPGQPVAIKVDAYPDITFNGRVESIQAGTGARFSLLPPENATGNYVKVVQRVPVKIVFEPDERLGSLLGVGMSVVPEVNVGETPAKAAR